MSIVAVNYTFYVICGLFIVLAGVQALRAGERLPGILLLIGGIGFVYRQALGIVFDYTHFVNPASSSWLGALLKLRDLDGIIIPIYLFAFSAGALLIADRYKRAHGRRD